jgi:mannose-6-phosphate isomerase-like protein (cupin superfamily)
VKGLAEVTWGQETCILSENQSTDIPIGRVHCLHNPSKRELEMIGVQSGCYQGSNVIHGRKTVSVVEPSETSI